MNRQKPLRIIKYVLLALLVGGAIAVAPRVRHWYLVDVCLDRGGAWDYANDSCDLPSSEEPATSGRISQLSAE